MSNQPKKHSAVCGSRGGAVKLACKYLLTFLLNASICWHISLIPGFPFWCRETSCAIFFVQ